jgi:hypothetical protein
MPKRFILKSLGSQNTESISRRLEGNLLNLSAIGIKWNSSLIKQMRGIGAEESALNDGIGNNTVISDDIEFRRHSNIAGQNDYIAYYDQSYKMRRDFLRKFALQGEIDYVLDTIAMRFYCEHYDESKLEEIVVRDMEQRGIIPQTTWDSIYKKGMDPVRAWMKKNQEEILTALNKNLVDEIWDKYAKGSLSTWEMDSLGFYYHDHELQNLKDDVYGITDIDNIPVEPEVERSFTTKDGSEIKMFKIFRIAGTVIDKDKNRSTVTLLTPSGVIAVKVWKNQFAAWDKQISERGADGVKHVVEKSWFQRGTKLIITGIRREDNFIPKKYKNTEYPLFEKIINMDDRGFILESAVERVEVAE